MKNDKAREQIVMTNEEMVVLFQQGELDFTEIVEQNKALINKELGRWGGFRTMDYDDKHNFLLVKFWEACCEFDVEAGFKFSTFATNKLYFAMKNLYRSSRTKTKGGGLDIVSLEQCLEDSESHYFETYVATEYDFLEPYHVSRITDAVERVLKNYDEVKRQYVHHFLYDNMTYTEIARMYDKKPAPMRTTIRRILDKVELEVRASGCC